MKLHPKIRKRVKWVGAVVSIFLVLVTAGSVWWKVWWGNGLRHSLSIDRGQVKFVFDPTTRARHDAQYGASLKQLPIAQAEELAARAVTTSDDQRWKSAVHQLALHELRIAQLRNGWGIARTLPGLRFRCDWDFRKGHWSVSIPIGVIAGVGTALSAVIWWRGFRFRSAYVRVDVIDVTMTGMDCRQRRSALSAAKRNPRRPTGSGFQLNRRNRPAPCNIRT